MIKEKLEEIAELGDFESDLAGGLLMIDKYPKGITILGSARTPETSKSFLDAEKLAAEIAKRNTVVITGGGHGIMGAANKGAFENGGISLGLNVILPNEQCLNEWTTDHYTFKHFFTRKQGLVQAGKGFVCFPGGFGTLDELTEILVQIQTGKIAPAPVVLYDSDFWKDFDHYVKTSFLEDKLIDQKDVNLYSIVNSIPDALEKLGFEN